MVGTKELASVFVAMMFAAVAIPAPAQMCTPAHECGDVNESSSVTAADALAVLKRAVGLDIALQCSCSGGDACEAGGEVQTGQTMCWDPLDTVVPVDPIDCIGTGQDGEFQKGLVPAYVDNGDGTITDERTTLMWEKLSDDGSIHDYDNFAYQWAGAFGKVADLNTMAFAGYSDWRLPNARELATLPNFSAYNPAIAAIFHSECVPGCTIFECSCTNDVFYWSSTTYQFTPTAAWTLDFKTASVASTKVKTSLLYVRAVRGGY
ncbi:MAG: DUF1566 domain-containing protein [Deltaproteobacteria bacterium]|nr:DUF1566 domain-containing protein [Deltaproteobacteria bacterium]